MENVMNVLAMMPTTQVKQVNAKNVQGNQVNVFSNLLNTAVDPKEKNDSGEQTAMPLTLQKLFSAYVAGAGKTAIADTVGNKSDDINSLSLQKEDAQKLTGAAACQQDMTQIVPALLSVAVMAVQATNSEAAAQNQTVTSVDAVAGLSSRLTVNSSQSSVLQNEFVADTKQLMVSTMSQQGLAAVGAGEQNGLAMVISGTNSQAASPLVQQASQAASPLVQQASQAASPLVQQASQAASPLVQQASQAASPLVQQASQAASPLVQQASQAVSPLVQQASQAVSPLVQQASQAVSPLVQQASQAVSPLVQQASQAASPLVQQASQAASPLVQQASQAASPLVQQASQAASPLVQQASQAASPLVQQASQAASPLVQQASQAASPLVQQASQAASPLVQQASQAASPLVQQASQAASPLVQQASQAASPLVQQASQAASPLVQQASQAASPLVQQASQAVSPLVQQASQAVSPLVQQASLTNKVTDQVAFETVNSSATGGQVAKGQTSEFKSKVTTVKTEQITAVEGNSSELPKVIQNTNELKLQPTEQITEGFASEQSNLVAAPGSNISRQNVKSIASQKDSAANEVPLVNETEFVMVTMPTNTGDAQNSLSDFTNTAIQNEQADKAGKKDDDLSVNFGALLGQTESAISVHKSTQSQQDMPHKVQDVYDIAGQIVEQAKLVKQPYDSQNSEMIIKLRPEHLGELTLKIAVENGIVNASFHSNSSDVRGIIESSLQQLKQDMSSQGLKVDNVEVYAGLGDLFSGGQQGESAFTGQQSKHSKANGTGNFVEAVEEVDEAQQTNSDSGVDYRI